MENYPVAFILASSDEVYKDNNVLYRLVKPEKDGNGVESTDRLVNVVPFRRKYQFRARSDIEEFVHEILTRPLVLQPVLHFGRGFGNCGACYSEESWVIMINQTHPKILSRLQMGLDAAKAAFAKGNSAELKFNFGKAIQRLYHENLMKKEVDEAKESKMRNFLQLFRFSEWEHAELIVRFYGYTAHPSERKDWLNVNLEFNFEDIVSDEILWSQIGSQSFPRPHLAPVSEEEIRHELPFWTINGVSPLQNMGEEIPHLNYSYKKAGTLYESFRKKKKQHDLLPNYNEYQGQRAKENFSEESLGAVGGTDDYDAIEHDFTNGNESAEKHVTRSSSRRAYMYGQSPHSNTDYSYDELSEMSPQSHAYENEHNSASLTSYGAGMYANESNTRKLPPLNSHLRPSELNGHVDANVRIVTPSVVAEEKSDENMASHVYKHALRIKKQDSDRSTGSTNADSGYCEDGRRSRGDSYDYNDNVSSARFSHGNHSNDKYCDSKVDGVSGRGLDNPAFSHHDEVDDALARHKRMVADAMASKVESPVVSHGRVNDTEPVAESFI